jgi:hypothetical protein
VRLLQRPLSRVGCLWPPTDAVNQADGRAWVASGASRRRTRSADRVGLHPVPMAWGVSEVAVLCATSDTAERLRGIAQRSVHAARQETRRSTTTASSSRASSTG